jgi:NitT/TauT family transport system substrate-binding protein
MKRYFLLVAVSLFAFSCGNTPPANTGQNAVRDLSLRFDWIPTMSFAGDIVAKNNFAADNRLNLKLNPAGEGIDPIKMVISGTDNIGIVGLDKLLLANEKGADLVAFAIVDNVTPTVFMSKKEKNIIMPQDLIGRKVGVQSGGATEYVYRSLLNKLGIDKTKINEVQIGFDMKPFVDGQYDVRPGFIFDEAVFLDTNNIPYNLIEPRKYGLNYPGRVYFAKREFIQSNPELIQRFVNTVAKGWQFALANPEPAIKQLQAFEPKINFDREYKGLVKAKEYFSGHENKILMPDIVAIEEMVSNLNEMKLLSKKPAISEYFDLRFVTELHPQSGVN